MLNSSQDIINNKYRRVVCMFLVGEKVYAQN